MRLAMTLEAASPLSLRSSRDTSRATSLAYIPGPTLLGSLAVAHLTLAPDNTTQFERFFLSGAVRYGNAYPTPTNRQLQDQLSPVFPLPLTARSCKRWPGFQAQQDADHEYHGVFDHLVPWALFALSEETLIDPLEQAAACPRCQAPLEALSGFYRRDHISGAIGRAPRDTALFTRTGISRETGAVQAGVIYSREVLPVGTRFWAEVEVDATLADEFCDFVSEAGESGFLRVGTSRTRGMGKLLVVSCSPRETGDPAEDAIKQRLEAWNHALQQAAEHAKFSLPPGWYVPLTLTADLLLRDRLLRWRLRLDEQVLADAGLPDATLVYHAASVRRVLGWNGLLGLPREDALAIGMGSVFLFRFPNPPALAALYHLEANGLGERTVEGFGRLTVADPFHWEVNEA